MQEPSRRPPDPFELSMLEYARRWLRYGGGPAAEIFEQFGLVEATFFRRVLVLLDHAITLDPAQKSMIRGVCRKRLEESAQQPTSG